MVKHFKNHSKEVKLCSSIKLTLLQQKKSIFLSSNYFSSLFLPTPLLENFQFTLRARQTDNTFQQVSRCKKHLYSRCKKNVIYRYVRKRLLFIFLPLLRPWKIESLEHGYFKFAYILIL